MLQHWVTLAQMKMMTDEFQVVYFFTVYIRNSALEWKIANLQNNLQIPHEVPTLFKNALRKGSLHQRTVEFMMFQCLPALTSSRSDRPTCQLL